MTYLPHQKSLAHRLPVALQQASAVASASTHSVESFSFAGGRAASAASPRNVVRGRRFTTLDLDLTAEDRAFWCFMKPEGRPSFTRGLLEDLAGMQTLIAELFAGSPTGDVTPFDYFILGSHSPGIFNLGGDLPLFVDCIHRGDRRRCAIMPTPAWKPAMPITPATVVG